MDEKELKTSPKQRVFITIIAVVMLGSIIASYAAIILNGSNSSDTSSQTKIDSEKVALYEEEYNKKLAEFKEATSDDYNEFTKYKSEIKAFNENSANENGVQTKDLKVGEGKELTGEDSDDYLAYYVGWCADESVFDSSFDDNDSPTSFAKVLNPSLGMIEGWNMGVKGMKVGGIRRITIPGELAYGDSMEICGGTNKPLRFMVMAVENKEPLKTLSDELETAFMRYQYAQYGIDYDSISENEG